MTFLPREKRRQLISRRIFLILSLAFVNGCIPMVHTFFEPSAETGNVEREACQGNAGPRNTIIFQQEEFKLSIYSRKKSGDALFIGISVKPSPEKVLHFLSQEFKVKVEGQVNYISPSEVLGFNYAGPSQEQESVLLKQWTTLQGGKYDIFFMHLYFPIGESTHFELQFPPMEIKQRSIIIPPIQFTKTSEFFINPINC